jgi:RimJ/RimL family protein N-acetyltransferase
MIIGERVRLRGIEREDIPTFVRWFNDPEVRRFLLFNEPMSKAQEERWFESRAEKEDYIFGVEALVDEQWVHIGNTGLHELDYRNGVAEFGIVIGEKARWSKGYGTEATRLTLGFAFGALRLNRVALEVFDFNKRAIRCYEKAGFTHEGTQRQGLFRDGQFYDIHWMGILAEEFFADKGA